MRPQPNQRPAHASATRTDRPGCDRREELSLNGEAKNAVVSGRIEVFDLQRKRGAVGGEKPGSASPRTSRTEKLDGSPRSPRIVDV